MEGKVPGGMCTFQPRPLECAHSNHATQDHVVLAWRKVCRAGADTKEMPLLIGFATAGALSQYEAATIMCLMSEEVLERTAKVLQQEVSADVASSLAAALERHTLKPSQQRRPLSKSPSR